MGGAKETTLGAKMATYVDCQQQFSPRPRKRGKTTRKALFGATNTSQISEFFEFEVAVDFSTNRFRNNEETFPKKENNVQSHLRRKFVTMRYTAARSTLMNT